MTKKNEEISLNQIPATSKDVRKEKLDKMREIYPALFGEGNTLNTKELQALVDDYSKPEVERYAFPWTGKTASKRFAFTPSKARLVPDKDRSVDFDTTKNLIIEGENLEVLKLLQSSYFKKVKMIYIDPPYNTGHDFVYPDDYSESKQAYWEKGGVMQEGVRIDTNSESSGRYHSNWLSMVQSRLLLARNLLRDDGAIFVSIDDNEVHNLRKLMDEIFGEENFVAQIEWQKRYTRSNNTDNFTAVIEHIVLYQKTDSFKVNLLARNEEANARFTNPDNDPRGPWKATPFLNQVAPERRPNLCYPLVNPFTGTTAMPGKKAWRYEKSVYDQLLSEDRLYWGKSKDREVPDIKTFLSEVRQGMTPINFWSYEYAGHTDSANAEIKEIFGQKIFDTPKPSLLIKRMLEHATDKESIVLDFFAGSGTTGQAVMELNKEDSGNRRFVLVQIPEEIEKGTEVYNAGYKTISQITIERVKRAGAKIKAEKPEVDTGFKTLRLAKSLFPQNMFEVDSEMTEEEKVKAWEAYLEKSKQAHLFDFKPDELLVEIALKDGFDLNFKAEPMKEFKKNKVLDVTDGDPDASFGTGKTALVCLDESIHDETIKALETFKERRFICLERSVDSTRKWNLKRMFGDNLWVA